MTEGIRTIFDKNITLIGDMDKTVACFREQQYNKALYILAGSINEINRVLEAIITNREYFNLVDTESILDMLTGILNAKKHKDYVLLADLLELQLISLLVGVQELIISKEEILFNEESYQNNIDLLVERGTGFTDKIKEPIDTAKLLDSGYRVEFTSCGLMTLAAENNNTKFYFHTNSRILTEAFLLAKKWYQKGKDTYVIYGFGMGYHIKELIKLDAQIHIEVYESDSNVLQLACAFADITDLLKSEQIKVIYDPEMKILENRIENLGENEVFEVHYPSYKNIRHEKGKKMLDAKLSWPDL